MKVLLSWLREFVDVPATGEEIGARMSLRGFALEGIAKVGDDEVLDFDVTSNRPDCMNVVGLAREVAAAFGHSLNRRPDLTPHGSIITGAGTAQSRDITISLDDIDLCPCYAGAAAHVNVAPSPDWMQARLKACGIRPISNIVDITNYVLLELGQPMHAFDLTTLRGPEIRVRTAGAGERITTLDGQDRALSPDMLVIADATAPVAIAGVMGGADSEVSDATQTILFESAYFNPRAVRRTARKLGMKTEASMRFERGADRMMPAVALSRALTLLEQIGAGTRRDMVVAMAPEVSEFHPTILKLRRSRISGFLGTVVPDEDVFRILGTLGLPAEPLTDGWTVTVPARRIDIHREVDLLEEVARHYGFDRIPSHFPALAAAPPKMDPRISVARALRGTLTGAGFSEAVTFGFIAADAAAPFAADGDVAAIANPLSETFAVLRPSTLPGLLDAVAHNQRRQQHDVRLFEIGNRFTRAAGERRALGCVWSGTATPAHWSGGGRDVDFFDIKGLAERVCEALGTRMSTEPADVAWLVPGRTAALLAGGRRIGLIGQVTSAVTERHGIGRQDAVYALEIDLDAGDATPRTRLQVDTLPRFPLVTRDISILVDDALPAATVRETIRAAAPATLISVVEFDRYQGKGVPEGKTSLSLRLTFQSPERTLTDAEVQSAMDDVLAALRDRHAAVQR